MESAPARAEKTEKSNSACYRNKSVKRKIQEKEPDITEAWFSGKRRVVIRAAVFYADIRKIS